MCSSGESVDLPSPTLLNELDAAGACKRGRFEGRRNRTAAERESSLEQRRQSKNARERQRVENLKNVYGKLQVVLGQDCRSAKKTRRCKLRLLITAAKRIESLLAEQNRLVMASSAGTGPTEPRPPPRRRTSPWAYHSPLMVR